jgi:hypothetical protein
MRLSLFYLAFKQIFRSETHQVFSVAQNSGAEKKLTTSELLCWLITLPTDDQEISIH